MGGRITGDDKLLAWPSKNVYHCRGKSKSNVILQKKWSFASMVNGLVKESYILNNLSKILLLPKICL